GRCRLRAMGFRPVSGGRIGSEFAGFVISVWVCLPAPMESTLTNSVPRSSQEIEYSFTRRKAVWTPSILDGECVKVSRTNDNVSGWVGKNPQSFYIVNGSFRATAR